MGLLLRSRCQGRDQEVQLIESKESVVEGGSLGERPRRLLVVAQHRTRQIDESDPPNQFLLLLHVCRFDAKTHDEVALEGVVVLGLISGTLHRRYLVVRFYQSLVEISVEVLEITNELGA